MKKVLLLCAAMALFATSAFAVGADLSVGGCPGNTSSSPAASDAGTLDCAGGQLLTLLATFMPAEAYTDLAGQGAIVDFSVGGTATTGAGNFWDLQTTNAAAINGTQARPASPTGVCTNYTNTWNVSGAGFATAQSDKSPSVCRVGVVTFRPTGLSTTANQKLFGFQLTIDCSTSAEAGGAGGPGCTQPATIVLQELTPQTLSGSPTTPLNTPSVFSNCVTANGGTNCGAVPAARHTWGQLKSLYR